MACQRLHYNALKPGRWHRLWCAECRAARAADATLALGVACMKAHPAPAEGLNRTLTAIGLPASSPGFRAQWRRAFRRLYLPAGTLALLLTAMGYGWLRYIDLDPNIRIPTPAMPSPNAYDFFRAAGQALIDDKKIGYAISKAPAKPNTAGSTPGNHIYSLEEKEALVRINARALQLVRQGFAYPYQEPPARSVKTQFPHIAQFRSLARLLALEAQVKAARGDWQGAVNSGLDAMQLGAQFPHGAPMIGKLTGIACEAIGREPIWDVVDHLNAQQAQAATRRLEKIRTLHVPYADTLQEEKWLGLASLQKDILAPGWRSTFATSGHTSDDYALSFEAIPRYIILLRYSKRQIVDNYTRYMDQAVATARMPGAKSSDAALPDDPVCQFLLPVFAQAGFKDNITEVQNALLCTTLALRAYRLDKGQYPESLAQLTPRYLRAVPLDAFALSPTMPNQTLQYRRTGQTYLLYSIGPDGVDNRGVPIQDLTKPRDKGRYLIEWGSKGDIVAGVNRP